LVFCRFWRLTFVAPLLLLIAITFLSGFLLPRPFPIPFSILQGNGERMSREEEKKIELLIEYPLAGAPCVHPLFFFNFFASQGRVKV
jgi:hypothetical protein